MVKVRKVTRLSRSAGEIGCAKCGCPSFERGSETDPAKSGDYLLLTFECATCGHVETRSVLKQEKSKNGRGRAP